ncbi:MAG: hypothetical protein H6673_08565 [Anaerolineales bacterium]|nr:hypothetical protein [Anaerolineales bacterium]
MLSLKQQLQQEIEHLTPNQQAYLLDMAKRMQQPAIGEGVSGKGLFALAEELALPQDELDAMIKIIEIECGRVDGHDWA